MKNAREIIRKLDTLKPWLQMRGEQGVDPKDVAPGLEQALNDALEKIIAAQSPADFPYHEPDDYAEILAARPDGPRILDAKLSRDEIYDRALAAWQGRSAGCILGIPVEMRKIGEIEALAKGLCEYPLTDYWPAAPHNRLHYGEPIDNFTLGKIERVGFDDDLSYTALNLHAAEALGMDFTSADLGRLWVEVLPMACTAEEAALKNMKEGVMPPESALPNNPYQEWIGAAIRADAWGYICPGRPEEAARYAWIDAMISHRRNGTYSEMFFAAMIAAAFCESDPRRLIDVALSEIPADCRLAEAAKDTVAFADQAADWRGCFDLMIEKYGHYHQAHAINNAAICLIALLYADGDFSRAISIAVMQGLDTDCNGATVGSIMGAALGTAGIPEHWTKPFNDRIVTYVIGEEEDTLTRLAERTTARAMKQLGM